MFAAWLREQLGTAGIHRHFHRLERAMSQLSDQLDQQNQVLGTVRDSLASLRADVDVIVNDSGTAAAQEAANRMQSTLDGLAGDLQSWRDSTPDADGSDQPAEPTEPQQG